jgi:hypothetical protein
LTEHRPYGDHQHADAETPQKRSHHTGAPVVPTRWRATSGQSDASATCDRRDPAHGLPSVFRDALTIVGRKR